MCCLHNNTWLLCQSYRVRFSFVRIIFVWSDPKTISFSPSVCVYICNRNFHRMAEMKRTIQEIWNGNTEKNETFNENYLTQRSPKHLPNNVIKIQQHSPDYCDVTSFSISKWLAFSQRVIIIPTLLLSSLSSFLTRTTQIESHELNKFV